MQHEQGGVHVVHKYEVDTLGAPFRVTLLDSVSVKLDPETGKSLVTIPDVVGLIGAVVRARVTHVQKLSGKEIKFIRDALGVQANKIARFLGITPEHLSRCEAGVRILSVANEKEFRCAAFLATLLKEPGDLFAQTDRQKLDQNTLNTNTKGELTKELLEFANAFISMKIKAAHSVDAPTLSFEFVRDPSKKSNREQQGRAANDDDDGKWIVSAKAA